MIVHDDPLKEAAAAAMLEENATDVVEAEIETTTEELLASSQVVGEISRNVETIGTVTESLESFVNQAFNIAPEGEWNARTARQFQMGVGAILGTVGVHMESKVYCSSFEAVGTTQTGDENREETKKKSEGLLKRMWEALKAAIASFVESVSKFIESFKNNIYTIRKMGRNLAGRARTNTGATNKTEFDSVPAWASYLQQGNQRYSSPKAALKTVGEYIVEIAESWQKSFVDHANDALFNKAHIGDGGYISDTIFNGIPQRPQGEWPGLKVIKLEGSKFGDVSISVKDSASKVNDVKLKVLTGPEIKELADGLDDLYTDMLSASQALNKAMVEVKRVQSKLQLDDADKVSPTEIGKLLGRIIQPFRVLAPLGIEIAKDAYRHGDASLKLMK